MESNRKPKECVRCGFRWDGFSERESSPVCPDGAEHDDGSRVDEVWASLVTD